MWRRARKLFRAERRRYLESLYDQVEAERNFGVWIEAPRIESPRTLDEAAPQILAQEERKDTCLWPALFSCWPDWHWGYQATGDCVGWAGAGEADINLAVGVVAGKLRKAEGLTSIEASYAFSKCELYNSYRYHGAGSTGYAMAEARVRFGSLYRRVYESGRNRIDLREYGDLSIQWGDRGRGVPDWLEPFAAEHKAQDKVQIRSALEGGLMIQSGRPFQYCGYTYWGTRRGSDGIATQFDRGWHDMVATGVRWNRDGTPLALWVQNWGHGDHCEGPIGPYEMPDVYADCGSWVPASRIDPVCRAGDCYATTLAALGWELLTLPDWGWGA